MIDIAFDIIAIRIAKKVLLSIVAKGVTDGIYKICKKSPEKKVKKALRKALNKVAHDNEFWKNDVTRQRDDVLKILIKKIGGTETTKIKLPSYLDKKTVDVFCDCLKKDNEAWSYLQELVRDYIIREIRDIALNTNDIVQDTNARVKNIEKNLDNNNTNSSTNEHFLTNTPSEADASNVLGRENDLEELWKMLSVKKPVLLTGLGGIGKTKLAQFIFHRYENQFDEVSWIEYKEDLRHSFLYRIEDYRDRNDPWGAMMNDLHNDGKTKLFVIDNVDDDANQNPLSDKELRNLTGWKNTTILLTSRLKEELPPYFSYELKALGKDDCIAVFNHYYGSEPDLEWVGNVVALAHYHTFTIELLAKGAKRENLESYYEKVKKGFEEVERRVHSEYDDENATIEWHLRCLFDIQKRSDADKKVLNSFAVLPVNCECSLEEIDQWFGFKNDDLDEVIQDGWLSFDGNKQAFSMHPLVRTIVRFDFADDAQGHKKTIAPEGTTDKILEFFSEAFFDIGDGYKSLQRRIDNAESVISAVAQKETKLMADVLLRIGIGFYYMSNYAKALEYYGKVLEIYKSKLGKNHPDTASTYNNIGEVYRAKGDYAKALEYFGHALEIWESKLGKKYYLYRVAAYNNIASVYQTMGDYENALVYYGKALAIVESKLDKYHPSTALTYNNIAFMYQAKGDYGNALEYYRKALEIIESKLGKNYPDIATTYDNIAGLYCANGDFDNALEYYGKALKIRESKLGKDHPDTATTYNNIALVYDAKGDYDNALDYYGKALEIYEPKLGKDHPDMATTYNNIARVYHAKGDYGNALDYFGKALQIYEPKLGKDHPKTAITYDNIGMVYLAKGDHGNALVYTGRALEIFESKLGKDHPDTAATYNNIAMVYGAKSNYLKALEYLLKALRIWLIKTKYHPNTISCIMNLTGCYQAANMGKDIGEWLKERLNKKEWEAYMELKGLL